jgi:hypothetical protein
VTKAKVDVRIPRKIGFNIKSEAISRMFSVGFWLDN